MADEVNEIEEEAEPESLRYKISSYGADYPVDSLVKRLNGDIIYLPEFQRHYVWSMTQASKFIESLLLGLPVPGIFLSKVPESNKMEIIDGQQRLRTLEYFYSGEFKGSIFKLTGITSQYEGKTYKTLAPEDRQVLDDAIIHTTIIRQDEPKNDDSSIYYIFERLNTGGTLLRPQEIRACVYHGGLNKFLSELETDKSWLIIYGKPDNRLKSQETILRFFSFLFYKDKYQKPLKEFLNQYMSANRNFEIQSREEMEDIFRLTAKYLADSLGASAFRPKGQLVASIIDSVMVSAAKGLKQKLNIPPKVFTQRYDSLVQNTDYLDYATNATSDEKVVEKRFQKSDSVLLEL